MTALPPALAGWARELIGLPPDLVAALAPWLGRLSIAIGPLGSPRGAPTGELDGVDGLARRGSYERLLMTEWAIGLEHPDEFLRRAGSGEHLFVAQARRQPSAARRSIAIVSAGPAQLGAPRLVHLAALVVLARRAAAGDAGFAWGVLEQVDDGLIDGAAPEALERMLARRTVVTATAAHAAAWAARLGAIDGDRWLIGDGPALAAAPALGAAILRVRDPLEVGVAAIDVEVIAPRARSTRARVRLPLPPPEDGARLIRDPFRRAVVAPAPKPTTGALRRIWFVPGSRRLAVQTDRRLELWPIPSSPRDAPGKPRLVVSKLDDAVIVALGARRRVPVIISWDPKRPWVLLLEDARLGPWPVEVRLPDIVAGMIGTGRRPLRGAPGACAYLALRPGQAHARVLVIDGPWGALLAVDEPRVGATRADARLLGLEEDFDETEVLGAAMHETAVFAALRPGGEIQLRELSRSGVHQLATTARRGFGGTPEDPGVRFGFRRQHPLAWGPVAIRVEDARWDVLLAGRHESIRCDTEVIGAYEDDGVVRLIALAADRRRIRMVGPPPLLELPHAGAEIVMAVAGSSVPMIAWATAAEIVVYSMHHDAVVLRIPRGAT